MRLSKGSCRHLPLHGLGIRLPTFIHLLGRWIWKNVFRTFHQGVNDFGCHGTRRRLVRGNLVRHVGVDGTGIDANDQCVWQVATLCLCQGMRGRLGGGVGGTDWKVDETGDGVDIDQSCGLDVATVLRRFFEKMSANALPIAKGAR
jgi:hypothetical protein